jgi:hypothetical protein
MDCGESLLTESKKALIFRCAKAMKVNKEKLQEVVDWNFAEGGTTCPGNASNREAPAVAKGESGLLPHGQSRSGAVGEEFNNIHT